MADEIALEEPVTRKDDVDDSRRSGPDHARTTGAALEAHYRFILWLVVAVKRFSRNRKFQLGDRVQARALDVQERLIGLAPCASAVKSLAVEACNENEIFQWFLARNAGGDKECLSPKVRRLCARRSRNPYWW